MATASLTSHDTPEKERIEEIAKGKTTAATDQPRASIGNTPTNPATAVTDGMEPVPEEMTKSVSKIPDEPVPINDPNSQSTPVDFTQVNSPKLHHSNRSNPPAPSALVMERQRTHTVMTVDQNLKAGINAYLEGLGGQTQTHQIIKVIKLRLKFYTLICLNLTKF
jgi:hypothetical protein